MNRAPATPPRSVFVTVLGWLVIVASALASLISGITVLMFLAGSAGTSGGLTIEGLLIIFGPPAMLVAGIGMLLRMRWALITLLAVLVGVLVYNGYGILKGATPRSTTTSASGVQTTRLASDANYSVPAITISLGLLVMLLSRKVRSEFGAGHALFGLESRKMGGPAPPDLQTSDSGNTVDPAIAGEAACSQSNPQGGPAAAGPAKVVPPRPNSQGDRLEKFMTAKVPPRTIGPLTPPELEGAWRVGHQGRDGMYYEERSEGAWQRIDIDGEMLTGRAHHVIYFASAERWQTYPDWARARRDEIISRIKIQFREPDYEYAGDDVPARPRQPVPGEPAPGVEAPASYSTLHRPHGKGQPGRWKQVAVCVLVLAVLLGVAGGMFGLVKVGLETGETLLPTKLASHRRSVSRPQEPVQFWISLGIYSAIGIGSLGLTVWGISVACTQGKSGHP